MHNGKSIGFTVFHDCAIPPDDFVANCRVEFADLDTSKPTHDLWVSVLFSQNQIFPFADGSGAEWSNPRGGGNARHGHGRCVRGNESSFSTNTKLAQQLCVHTIAAIAVAINPVYIANNRERAVDEIVG